MKDIFFKKSYYLINPHQPGTREYRAWEVWRNAINIKGLIPEDKQDDPPGSEFAAKYARGSGKKSKYFPKIYRVPKSIEDRAVD